MGTIGISMIQTEIHNWIKVINCLKIVGLLDKVLRVKKLVWLPNKFMIIWMKSPGNTMRLSVSTNLTDDLFIFIIVILLLH
jgi:hypothetical protein